VHGEALSPDDAAKRLQHVLAAGCAAAENDRADLSGRDDVRDQSFGTNPKDVLDILVGEKGGDRSARS
jgi:hypothetical protein